MADDSPLIREQRQRYFRPYTRTVLAAPNGQVTKENGKTEDNKDNSGDKVRGVNREKDGAAQPDPKLEQGARLPARMRHVFPAEMASTPLEDFDHFYKNKKTFVVVSKGGDIFRFSGEKSLWMLDPFSPIRRVSTYTMVQPIFAYFIMITIMIHCIIMIMPSTSTLETLEIVFLTIYTIEVVVKVLARGFILHPFAYLRDPWNWLDFLVTLIGYITMGIDLGSLYALRAFRVLRTWRTVTIIPGWRTVLDALSLSIRNLRDLLYLLLFTLFIIAVLGLQLYMGVLTQKCIHNFPTNGSWGNITHENWHSYMSNSSHWFNYSEDWYEYPVCGNSSGARMCPPDYTCLQGFGQNPNYGYTNFDTFGWSFMSVFRLVTLDYWEDLYQKALSAAGPWHMLFFIFVVFYGTFCFLNSILAVVVMAYTDMVRKAEEEEAVEREIKEENKTTNVTNNVGDVQELTTIEINDEAAVKDNGNQAAGQLKKPETPAPSATQRLVDLFCVWDCCAPWQKLQAAIGAVVLNPFFELFIVVIIVLNTITMALDHHDMNIDFERVLKNANYVFTLIYIIEAVLKITAMSPKFYFKVQWNIFDFIIVAFSILELVLEGVQGLSVLRSFRLLRVLRLAKFWPTLNKFVSVMTKSSGAFVNVIYIMFILLFIFSVVGLQLFGENYVVNVDHFPDGEMPRWNFTDFLHSFMIVFRALCGEWIESMWDCMLIADWSCIPFFVATFFIGNLIILNLLIALLLNNYGSFCTSSETADEEDSKTADALTQITSYFKRFRHNLNVVKMSPMKSDSEDIVVSQEIQGNNIADTEDDVFTAEFPPDCCCNAYYKCFPSSSASENSAWSNMRRKCFLLAKNKYFDKFVTAVIVITSVFLALEDVYLPEKPILTDIILYVDYVLTAFFIIEMIIMWFAVGFKKYFTSAWYWLDFIVAIVYLLNFVLRCAGIESFHILRLLRVFRLIRPLSKIKGMKVMLNTLVEALPHIFNVILVGLFFWLVFAIIGVQLFAGKFFKCVDDNSTTLSHEIIPDRNTCMAENHTWVNSPMNFDHVGNAYLCLLQVATFKGWIQIMNDAIDSREVSAQPIRETNIYMYLYFVIFIIFGSFFILKLFVCVLIDIFRQQRNKAEGLPATGSRTQGIYQRALARLASKKPVKRIPKPTCQPQSVMYDISISRKFEYTMMIMIILNVVMMAFDHYQISMDMSVALTNLNLVFIVIFLVECVIKISGLRHHYFKDPWNVIDFLYVVLAVVGIVTTEYIFERYFISPTLLRIVRVLRVGRLLRHFQSTRGMRLLVLALKKALPSLFNVSVLLFVVIFIYAVFGMEFFKHVMERAAIDDLYNFRTFGQSTILLFQLATSAGWDGVFHAIVNEDDCTQPDHDIGHAGDCGSRLLGIIYMVSYLVIACLVVVNMYAAVVLDYVLEVFDDAKEGLTDDDFDVFFERWQQFDPEATQYIPYDQLSELLDALDPPLQVLKPNKYKILSMNIPICKDDHIFYKDVLEALVKDVFARRGRPVEAGDVQAQNNGEADYKPVSSTMQRQREDYCVRLIQNAWRKHKQQT